MALDKAAPAAPVQNGVRRGGPGRGLQRLQRQIGVPLVDRAVGRPAGGDAGRAEPGGGRPTAARVRTGRSRRSAGAAHRAHGAVRRARLGRRLPDAARPGRRGRALARHAPGGTPRLPRRAVPGPDGELAATPGRRARDDADGVPGDHRPRRRRGAAGRGRRGGAPARGYRRRRRSAVQRAADALRPAAAAGVDEPVVPRPGPPRRAGAPRPAGQLGRRRHPATCRPRGRCDRAARADGPRTQSGAAPVDSDRRGASFMFLYVYVDILSLYLPGSWTTSCRDGSGSSTSLRRGPSARSH